MGPTAKAVPTKTGGPKKGAKGGAGGAGGAGPKVVGGDGAPPWCELTFPPAPPAQARYTFLLSTSLFYFPKYTRAYRARGVFDETHEKQSSFVDALRYYAALFEIPWFKRHVLLRVYYDDSLLLYTAQDGTPPWPGILAALGKNDSFQLVGFRCADPRFRETVSLSGSGSEVEVHRGLLGTLMRFHAAFDFPENRIADTVCLIDVDSLYTPAWWREHMDFLRAGDAKKILAFTGPFEVGLHGYLPPESAYIQPFVKGGFTSFKQLLPAAEWTDFPNLWEGARPALRYLDALRTVEFGEKGSAGERLYEDFGYGVDEAVLNALLLDKSRAMGLREVTLCRPASQAIPNFMAKLAAAFRWNGARSVPFRQLCAAMGDVDPDKLVAAVTGARINGFADLETSVVSQLRPHAALMERMQMDARLIHVIRTFSAADAARYKDSRDYLVATNEAPRLLAELAAKKTTRQRPMGKGTHVTLGVKGGASGRAK